MVSTYPGSIYSNLGRFPRHLVVSYKAYEDGSLYVLAAWSDLATDKAGSVCSLTEKVVPELSSTELAHFGKVDPTDLPTSQVIQILRCILCQCLGDGFKQSDVSVNEPLRCLGLDSAQSIEFQSLLEEKFTVLLPDELLFEQD
eukprot:gene35175-45549_t